MWPQRLISFSFWARASGFMVSRLAKAVSDRHRTVGYVDLSKTCSWSRRADFHPDPEANPWGATDQNPDSPGLEAFYSKDAFVCEADGRPKWCSDCQQWKPDRAHHFSELARRVRKMDHLCPWVDGMVSETSFSEAAGRHRTPQTGFGKL
ncbi:palmitoyltransferase pfa5 [Purpureocillium lilacinum]|nr:palmitoyltransferase pfa5 [Purpureocillium lilacinum]